MGRVVLNTFGSFGDVHPYLAIAIELRRRGHDCVLATSEAYRRKITAEGFEFFPVRPDVGELLEQPELIQRLWHPSRGSIYLLRDYLLPKIEDSYRDLSAACTGANLLLTHPAAYAGPIVANERGIPWLSIALQPAIFFSTYEPWAVPAAPSLRHLHVLGRWPFRLLRMLAERETRRWARPVFHLRGRLGQANDANPVMDSPFSPLGTLALFSPVFAPAQPDWPDGSQATGFVFYDKRGDGFGLPAVADGLSAGLRKFLSKGAAPVLFTLGSSAVTAPGSFYRESAAAALALGVRAVLLTGKQVGSPVTVDPHPLLHVEEYAPYSELMPSVSAVVHQGGIGTVAQTLRAGKPMLVVPWAHDQPDNGYRLERLGVARVIPRRRYARARAAGELSALLNGNYAAQAAGIAARMSEEDGLTAACDRIENQVKLRT